MKKIFAISLVMCGLFVFAGCEEKISEYEKTMKDYATSYYNNLQKGTEGLTTVKVTVGQLRKAVELNVVDYDMSKLTNCTDESYVELKINQTNNEVDSIDYHLQCEK